MKRLLVLASAAALLMAAPVAAQSGKSLNDCEKALARETTKLAVGVQKAVGKCLDKLAGELLAKGDPVADAARACASSLRKLQNSETPDATLAAKFAVKVAKVCDPTVSETLAEHTADQVLDPNDAAGLRAGLLDAYCGEFGGDGTLDDVGEWIDCAAEAALCSGLLQVAVEYPRAPEWLGQIATAITALGADAKYNDAAAVAVALVARIDRNMDGAADISCGMFLSTCGDGTVDAGEQCDQADLNGTTCIDEGFAGGTLTCGGGCSFDTSGCYAARFVDNLDGTISDLQTGLMWEKKSDDGSIHDQNNAYPWGSTTAPYPPDGTAFTEFLAGLNGGGGAGTCFAGYCDWRLPTREELQELVMSAETPPMIDPIFKAPCTPGCSVTSCSCTLADGYLSASTWSTNPAQVWHQSFGNGNPSQFWKTTALYVRAVRRGS